MNLYSLHPLCFILFGVCVENYMGCWVSRTTWLGFDMLFEICIWGSPPCLSCYVYDGDGRRGFGPWFFESPPLGGLRLPLFRTSACGLKPLYARVCVVTVCKSGGGHMPLGQYILCEVMYNWVVFIHWFAFMDCRACLGLGMFSHAGCHIVRVCR